MTDDERLERIEQRAKGLGWRWDKNPECERMHILNTPHVQVHVHVEVPQSIVAAEALLSLYEPAPVVVIKQFSAGPDSKPIIFCERFCEIRKNTNGDMCYWAIHEPDCADVPGPECPGPAPDGKEWVMVLRSKVEDG